jgi:holin-like protein
MELRCPAGQEIPNAAFDSLLVIALSLYQRWRPLDEDAWRIRRALRSASAGGSNDPQPFAEYFPTTHATSSLTRVDPAARFRRQTVMIRGFFILLAFQLVGEVAARGLALPAPGPVIGLALLVIALGLYQRWRPLDEEALAASDVGQAARGLLAALPLLFVPAGVGVVQYMGLLREQGLALAVALVASTLATLLATVGVFLLVKRLTGAKGEA